MTRYAGIVRSLHFTIFCFCVLVWFLSGFSVCCSCLLLLVVFFKINFFVYLEFQLIRFVISTFMLILTTPKWDAAKATGLGFFCFAVINPCVLSAKIWVLFFCLCVCVTNFDFTPPPSG